MSINGKHDHFDIADFHAVANRFNILPKKEVEAILEHTAATLARWPDFADEAGVPEQTAKKIALHHRTFL